MRIRTIAELSQPWDESSTSTNATVNTNDGNNSTNSNTSTPSIHILPQPLPHNPYQPVTQPSLPTRIMNNLRSWILTPQAPPPPQLSPLRQTPQTSRPKSTSHKSTHYPKSSISKPCSPPKLKMSIGEMK